MKKHHLILAIGLVAAATYSWSGSSGSPSAPDERLVKHFSKICDIAEEGVDSPYMGVQKLFSYYGKHTPTMFKEWGELLVLIESIEDPDKHDARARRAGRRLSEALVACEETWEDFGDAIYEDEEALELLEYGVNRLGRTLEILLSGGMAGHMSSLPGFESLVRGTVRE